MLQLFELGVCSVNTGVRQAWLDDSLLPVPLNGDRIDNALCTWLWSGTTQTWGHIVGAWPRGYWWVPVIASITSPCGFIVRAKGDESVPAVKPGRVNKMSIQSIYCRTSSIAYWLLKFIKRPDLKEHWKSTEIKSASVRVGDQTWHH